MSSARPTIEMLMAAIPPVLSLVLWASETFVMDSEEFVPLGELDCVELGLVDEGDNDDTEEDVLEDIELDIVELDVVDVRDVWSVVGIEKLEGRPIDAAEDGVKL